MSGPHIAIVGLMGVGKSTIAAALSAILGLPWRDSDSDIQTLTGTTGRAIAADPAQGVDVLHSYEEAVLLGALAADQPSIISAAGWVVESARCRAALQRRASVVWLDVAPEVLEARVKTATHRRPMSLAEIAAVAAKRARYFEEMATIHVDGTRPAEDIVRLVRDGLSRPAVGT